MDEETKGPVAGFLDEGLDWFKVHRKEVGKCESLARPVDKHPRQAKLLQGIHPQHVDVGEVAVGRVAL